MTQGSVGDLGMGIGWRRDIDEIEIALLAKEQILPRPVDPCLRELPMCLELPLDANVSKRNNLEISEIRRALLVAGRVPLGRNETETDAGPTKLVGHSLPFPFPLRARKGTIRFNQSRRGR